MQRIRRLLAPMGLSVLSVALLLVALKFSDRAWQPPAEEQIIVREMSLAAPPPPPPPQPSSEQVQTQASVINLDLAGGDVALPIEFRSAEVQTQMTLQAPPLDPLKSTQWEFEVAQDWSVFGLGELDKLPQLLSPVKVRFPAQLIERGIDQGLVKLHVIINQAGDVSLKSVTHLQYPELRRCVSQVIAQAKYEPPLKDGKPVSAEFIWPLELKHI